MKCCTLKWPGCVISVNGSESMRSYYMGESKWQNVRWRTPVKWMNTKWREVVGEALTNREVMLEQV